MGVWKGAVTQKGLALKAKLMAGEVFVLKGAIAGGGLVPSEELDKQTEVTLPIQELDIDPITVDSDAKTAEIPVLMLNEFIHEPCVVHQVGIIAEDPDEGDILYCIIQSEDGDRIPSVTEMHQFSATWMFTIAFGNAETVEVKLDSSGYVTQGQIENTITNLEKNVTGKITLIDKDLNKHVKAKNNPHNVTWKQTKAASKEEFDDHVKDTDVHITVEQKEEWTYGSGYWIDVTFEEDLIGEEFTISGESFSFSGVVTDSLNARVKVPFGNTLYSLSYLTYTRTADIPNEFGIYYIYIISGYYLDITFDTILSDTEFKVSSVNFEKTFMVPEGLNKRIKVPYLDSTYTITTKYNNFSVTITEKSETITYVTIKSILVLNSCSWELINNIASKGLAGTYWKIGDTKDITLSTGEILTLQIYGFDHDGINKITFGLKNLMATTQAMDSTVANGGYQYGFIESTLYKWLSSDIWNSLPSDLQEVIKSVTKRTKISTMSNSFINHFLKIFLFSTSEVCDYAAGMFSEGSKYEIFTDNASRIKYLSNGDGIASDWWLRSPNIHHYPSAHCSFFYVTKTGEWSYSGVSGFLGINFGFCV